jgi:hypothetical protein
MARKATSLACSAGPCAHGVSRGGGLEGPCAHGVSLCHPKSESRPRYIRATGPHASRGRGSADERYHTGEQKPRPEQPRRGEPAASCCGEELHGTLFNKHKAQ